jgi:transposase
MISDQLWDEISPFLPPGRSKRRLDDRRVLEGILYVLSHGIAWYDLPPGLGYGSGMTCWRRLRDWHARGMWRPMQKVLARHFPAGQLNFARIIGGDATNVRTPPRNKPRRLRTSFLGSSPAAQFGHHWGSHHGPVLPHHRGRERQRTSGGAAVPSSPFAQ